MHGWGSPAGTKALAPLRAPSTLLSLRLTASCAPHVFPADVAKCQLQLRDVAAALRAAPDAGAEAWRAQLAAVRAAEALIRAAPDELSLYAAPLTRALLHAQLPPWADDDPPRRGAARAAPRAPAEEARFRALVAAVAAEPEECGVVLALELYSPSLDTRQRSMLLEALSKAAGELAAPGSFLAPLPGVTAPAPAAAPAIAAGGAAAAGAPAGRVTRVSRGSLAARRRGPPAAHANRFAPVALKWAAALLRECDVRRHGIDLFGRDHFLLGRLLVTLGAPPGFSRSVFAVHACT